MEELTTEQVTALREAFSAHDRDGDGRITLQELRQALERLGDEPTDAELRILLVKADADDNETIDFAEFLAFMSRRTRATGTEGELREAFDAFDRNRDGLVSIDELLQLMGRLGEEIPREEAEASLRRGDSDGDGQLTYEEFVAFMMSPR
ncbi:MAG: EF-hand domain-containing protein [Myxococcaceae bacterium]|nr:EF-hand domain-containing protein [Myxococcaceae bacterium]